jgi:hypothetical protein
MTAKGIHLLQQVEDVNISLIADEIGLGHAQTPRQFLCHG